MATADVVQACTLVVVSVILLLLLAWTVILTRQITWFRRVWPNLDALIRSDSHARP